MENVINYEGLIEVYINLRQLKEDIKEEYESRLEPVKKRMEQIESVLNGELNRLGIKSIPTNKGTVLRTTWTKVNIVDWDAVLQYIVENKRYDLLKKDLTKTAVMDTVQQAEENKEANPIPGIAIETGLQVSIRRK